jgi:hypothetical protein
VDQSLSQNASSENHSNSIESVGTRTTHGLSESWSIHQPSSAINLMPEPMPQNIVHLQKLKASVSRIDFAYQSIATTIGLLATSGLHADEQMPDMCHLLKHIFKLQTCGFFWSDKAGNMEDAWCLTPDFLNFKMLTSCHEFQRSGNRAWPTFQENVLRGAGAGYLIPFQNERFYSSPHFQLAYAPINVRHILDVVLHDGMRPLGAFLMMRSEAQGCFTPDERRLMERLIPILNQAFSVAPMKSQYSAKEASGFALVGQDGKCKSMSEEARRIVWMITHTQLGSFAKHHDLLLEEHLEQLVAKYHAQIDSTVKFSVDLDNCWGRFNLMLERESKTQDTIVILRRKIPSASQLAFSILQFNFPPIRQIVAWLLAQNKSRNEIAITLETCVDTVSDHIKHIYKATGTSSSHGLLMRLGK